jgi:hypothetical protein
MWIPVTETTKGILEAMRNLLWGAFGYLTFSVGYLRVSAPLNNSKILSLRLQDDRSDAFVRVYSQHPMRS